MMKWYFIFVFCIGSCANSMAQAQLLNTWFDLERDINGLAVIKGKIKNKSNKNFAYSYSMKLSKAAVSGNTMSTQSGSFTLAAGEEKTLSVVSINLGLTASFDVTLKVFDDQNIVAEEKMVSDEKFISDFQKLAPRQSAPVVMEQSKAETPKKKNIDALEIGGLIIDETRSKTGRDYYELFYSKWVAPSGVSDFSIVIKELPARGRGARISMEVNGNLLFQRFLQPRLEVIEILAEQSVNTVKKYLIDKEKLKSDLLEGDQKGSGIY